MVMQQKWSLDSLGNFSSVTTGSTTETRSVDPANEIQSISDAAAPAYDLAGNMTTTPDPSDESAGLTCVYDAWNRLVQVSSGGTILAEYQYDGTGRRIVEFTNYTGSTPETVTYSYFSGQNAIETRTGSATSSPTSLGVQYQYVFSPLGDSKTPILRDTYSSGSIVPDDRLYYLTDANTNVTAVVGLSGSTWQVQERYVYDAYGAVTVYSGGWSQIGTSLAASTVGNTVGFASMVLDPATGLYNDEARWYSTAVSTFISRDPAQADLNSYRYCGNIPTEATDPTGLWATAGSGAKKSCVYAWLIASPVLRTQWQHTAIQIDVWNCDSAGQASNLAQVWSIELLSASEPNHDVRYRAGKGPVGTVDTFVQFFPEAIREKAEWGIWVSPIRPSNNTEPDSLRPSLGREPVDTPDVFRSKYSAIIPPKGMSGIAWANLLLKDGWEVGRAPRRRNNSTIWRRHGSPVREHVIL